MAKYQYLKVIQFGYNGEWSDESEYPTKANGYFRTRQEQSDFKADLANYKLAHSRTGQTRVISRRVQI